MFGYDDQKLEQLRAPRAWSRVVVGLELLALVLGLTVIGGAWLFTTPEGLQRVLNRLVGDAPVTVTLEDVDVLPASRLLAPRTWQLMVTGIVVLPHDPDQPRIQIERVILGLPDVARAWVWGHLALEQVRVVGLDVHAPKQRPPKPWTPTRSALSRVEIGRLEIWDARYRADADPPLLEAEIQQVYGELWDLTYRPGERELTGRGKLHGARFRSGWLEITHLHVDDIEAKQSDILLHSATFRCSGGTASLVGELRDVHRKPDVTLVVDLKDGRAEQMVETATGQKSPLLGQVAARLTVRSGGDLPRGGAQIEGTISLTDGVLPLGPEVKGFIRDMLDIAPFIELDDRDRVLLGPMTGRMRFSRGSVLLQDLIYQTPNRLIQLWGLADEKNFELTMRLVPARDPSKAGVGLILHGTADRVRVRLPRREELVPGARPDQSAVGVPADHRDERPERKRRTEALKLPAAFKKKSRVAGVVEGDDEP